MRVVWDNALGFPDDWTVLEFSMWLLEKYGFLATIRHHNGDVRDDIVVA